MRCKKVAYRTENVAIVKLASMWRRVRAGSGRRYSERTAYRCDRCGRWHLTSGGA